jgi:hypothetical protein
MANTTTLENAPSYNWLAKSATIIAVGATLMGGLKVSSDGIEQHCQPLAADIMQTPGFPEGLCDANQALRELVSRVVSLDHMVPQPSMADRRLGS